MARRRRQVQEQGARRRLRRLFVVLGALTLAALLTWLLQSPLLALETVTVTGVERSAAAQRLAAAGVVEGRPLVAMRPWAVESALLEDPWIAAADVTVVFPGTVEVRVEEREPLAWSQLGAMWGLLAEDGVLLEVAAAAPEGAPRLRLAGGPLQPGDTHPDADVLGALEFLAALAPELAAVTELRHEGRELWATVGPYQVRLGRAVDMAAKALTLEAVLAPGQPEGATITLIAPSRPAVAVPGGNPQPEGET